MAGLADHDALRLTPGEVEHLGRDELVVKNDLGRLQRAHRLQREEIGIARSRADERHAAFGRGALGRSPIRKRRPCEQALTQRRLRLETGFGERPIGEALPEGAPLGKADAEARESWAPIARGLRPALEPLRQERLDLGADRLGEDRRRAIRRDRDEERRSVDDRAELQIAEARLVDDVEGNARAPRRVGKAFRLGVGSQDPRWRAPRRQDRFGANRGHAREPTRPADRPKASESARPLGRRRPRHRRHKPRRARPSTARPRCRPRSRRAGRRASGRWASSKAHRCGARTFAHPIFAHPIFFGADEFQRGDVHDRGA